MSITGKTKLAGVMGWPISHSLSPTLHNFWFKQYDIDAAYLPLAVDPNSFEQAFRALPKLGFKGVNVTIPHKERAFELVDERDDVAQRMGAVNTVFIDGDGRMRGSNTDGFGFNANLHDQAPSWHPSGSTAVLVGTGGATRAIAVALANAGVSELILTNRTRSRAEDLAGELEVLTQIVDWRDRSDALVNASLLVNCTSLGMVGQMPLELDIGKLPIGATVVDIVYRPVLTPLLARARERGHAIVDGLGMLIHQATPGFEHWGGVSPVVDDSTRELMMAAL